jgi:hypothetical protein
LGGGGGGKPNDELHLKNYFEKQILNPMDFFTVKKGILE